MIGKDTDLHNSRSEGSNLVTGVIRKIGFVWSNLMVRGSLYWDTSLKHYLFDSLVNIVTAV